MACDMTYYRHLRASSEPVFEGESLDDDTVGAEQVRDTVVNECVAVSVES